MITELSVIFNSDYKREFATVSTRFVIVEEFISWTSEFTIILIISVNTCKLSWTSSQTSTVPIKVPSRITRIITKISSPFISVFVWSSTISHTRSIEVERLVFCTFIITEIFTSS